MLHTEYTNFTIEKKGYIYVITLHNPPVNAIAPDMLDELDIAFTALDKELDVRCVVIASAYEKAWVAGADIKKFNLPQKYGYNGSRDGNDVFLKIMNFRKPVIAAINAYALGGGLELAMACDFRVIDKTAKVGFPEAGLGIMPGYGGTQRSPRMCGLGMAKYLAYTTNRIDGEEAYRIGLAEVLAEKGEALNVAMEIAQKICDQAPLAITELKRVMNYTINGTLEDGICQEVAGMAVLRTTEDKVEGANAFVQKRKPEFKGR